MCKKNQWKENVLENMKAEKLVLEELKREFGREYDELSKVEELKRVKQESRMIKELV